MITLSNIHKSFGRNHVLKGIDLTIRDGEAFVIIGASGSGKTTLLRAINFLERADQGEISIGGVSVSAKRATKKQVLDIRRRTAMVFQNYNLFRNRTAIRNVAEGLVIVQKVGEKEALERAAELMAQVGLSDKLDAYPSQLSGGQQQRVAIARALALRPEVILFDEPTSALDPELVGEVLGVMREVARMGITMILVTHEMSFARDIASQIVFIDDGVIVEQGAPIEIFRDAKEERTRQFLRRIMPEFTYHI
ncbi:MAG: amino acid ABC transporter ATP-binding protein [Oscillospiraceae bacterium]|jgi:L-cystine transport system ATP-binding protein|nr:amino acid ABC transporter ATP-binding protein [Oscillospiraceae bacterium]